MPIKTVSKEFSKVQKEILKDAVNQKKVDLKGVN